MRITRLKLESWRNFRELDLPLRRRVFIVGPNASGKSNLLDALRFLREIAEPEGGLQRAVSARDGVSQVRCFHARQKSTVAIEVELELGAGEGSAHWSYRLEFSQDSQRRPVVKKERVARGGTLLLDRPDREDESDPSRLTQTHLEQVIANREFREVADSLAQIRYLHVVPQLIRQPERVQSTTDDPFGSDFLQRLASTPKKTLEPRLRQINKGLKVAVPQLTELKLERDVLGVPHLKGRYEHWRPKAGWQSEEHFSDGTLRLFGLLWAFLDGTAPLLLEEPELSLHPAIVRHIPSMMARAGRTKKIQRQVLISTHSPDLLTDESIAPEEVVLLEPGDQGTRAQIAADRPETVALLQGKATMAEAILPATAPRNASQLALFGT